jgi:uncharacterized protein YdhG (YjbR/CyaY superfamily)
MASSAATTVAGYLAELPEDRRKVIAKVRSVIRKHMPKGYREGMNYGMLTWEIPLSTFPDTYNKQPLQYVGLAAQKNNYAVYLQAVYGEPALEKWWRAAYHASGKKLDMGKSCVRFKTLDDLPLDVLGECIARVPVSAFLARYAAVKGSARKARRSG